jgi:very-short-patch-repair endonuclease
MASPNARTLRGNATDAERHLWFHIRRKQLSGFRFRRQQPMGPYIVDFFCPEASLIIEIDGGQHDESAERDAVRMRWLEERGYRVLRFWNSDVLGNLDGVLSTIRGQLIG